MNLFILIYEEIVEERTAVSTIFLPSVKQDEKLLGLRYYFTLNKPDIYLLV